MSVLVIIGAGGHAKVLASALRRAGTPALACVDARPEAVGGLVLDVPVLGDDAWLQRTYPPNDALLVNGIGGTGSTAARRAVFERFKALGYGFATVIDPSAIVCDEVRLGEGAQILAGAAIQPGTEIGDNSIINTRAAVDHDCRIGAHVHIAPGATLSGGVVVEDGAHVGTGATIIQSVRVGAGGIIGAGAVLVASSPVGATLVGAPARVVKTI
jgi:sugar O-acyltransferase (sialic acid O-acetyltransferase NeuD family)